MPAAAVAQGLRTLALQPHDFMVKCQVIDGLLAGKRLEQAEQFLRAECDWGAGDFGSTSVAYSHLLLNFEKWRRRILPEQELVTSLTVALKQNPRVPEHLVSERHLHLPESVSVGSPEEAVEYARRARRVWRCMPTALEWMAKIAAVANGKQLDSTYALTLRNLNLEAPGQSNGGDTPATRTRDAAGGTAHHHRQSQSSAAVQPRPGTPSKGQAGSKNKMAAAQSTPKCAVCAADAVKKCSRCKAVCYCSTACQTKHWKEMGHKKRCKELVAAQVGDKWHACCRRTTPH